MQLGEYIKRWRAEVLSTFRPTSQRVYESHIRRLQPLHDLPLTEVRHSEVRAFLHTLNLEPRSINNIWSTLRQILREAEQEDLIPKVPRVRSRKPAQREPAWFTVEQMRALFAAANGQEKLLYYLLAETGCRIGEGLGLEPGDLSYNDLSLTIRRSRTSGEVKTPSSLRTIAVSGTLALALSSYWTTNPVLFQQKETHWRDLFRTRLEELSFPSCGFHAFRHGARTLWSQIGMPFEIAERRMGHSLKKLDLGYGHKLDCEDRPWIQKIDQALRG